MGKFVLKMTKATEIIQATLGELSWEDNTEDTREMNPASGYININAFEISFENGIESESSPNLTMKRPRMSIGNEQDIPISLSCEYNVQEDNGDFSATDLVDAVSYLTKASNSGYYGFLYWIPNSDDEIISGQCQDYHISLIRAIHESEWSGAKLSSVDSEYGVSYEPHALPVFINGISAKQGTDKVYNIGVDLTLATRED